MSSIFKHGFFLSCESNDLPSVLPCHSSIRAPYSGSSERLCSQRLRWYCNYIYSYPFIQWQGFQFSSLQVRWACDWSEPYANQPRTYILCQETRANFLTWSSTLRICLKSHTSGPWEVSENIRGTWLLLPEPRLASLDSGAATWNCW